MNEHEKDPSPIQRIIDAPLSKIRVWREYSNTKKAVLSGEELFRAPDEEVKKKGYLTPWKFNCLESIIAGGIATTLVNLFGFISRQSVNSSSSDSVHLWPSWAALWNDGFDPRDWIRLDDMESIHLYNTVASWVEPFIIPIFISCFVFSYGFCTLKTEHATKERKRIARRAFLYFDGAYGLWTQVTIAACLGVLSTKIGLESLKISNLFALVVVFALVSALVWQFWLLFDRIPKAIFKVNGYSIRGLFKAKTADEPPWGKLVAGQLFSLYVLSAVLMIGSFLLVCHLSNWLNHILTLF